MTRRTSRKLKKSRRKSRSYKKSRRSFGINNKKNKKNTNIDKDLKNVEKHLKSKSKLLDFLSKYLKKDELLKLLLFSENVTENTLKNITPDKNKKLNGIKEKFQLFILNMFKWRIDNFIKNLTPEQMVLISEDKYNEELKKILLYGIQPSSDEEKIKGVIEKSKLMILKSFIGKNLLIEKFKKFLRTLTTTQMILLINGKFSPTKEMFRSILTTKYPDSKTIKTDLDKLKNFN